MIAIDVAVAAALAALVVIVSPGPAVDAIVAAIVLVVCGLSFAVERLARVWRRRRRPSPYG
jgi:hypothetical protein